MTGPRPTSGSACEATTAAGAWVAAGEAGTSDSESADVGETPETGAGETAAVVETGAPASGEDTAAVIDAGAAIGAGMAGWKPNSWAAVVFSGRT